MLLFLLTAETCGDGNIEVTKEDRLSGMFQDIEDEFVNDELTPEILFAFEKRAIQKLNDFIDYLNIYADTSLSKQFRIQARQMIIETFYSETDLYRFYQDLGLLEDTTNRILYNSKNGGLFKTEIDSIVVTDNFLKQAFSGYVGELRFSQKLFRITSTDTVLTNTLFRNSEIFVIKTEKEFGEKTQDFWKLYLGEIN